MVVSIQRKFLTINRIILYRLSLSLFHSSITMLNTNGITIQNNIIYRTYRSGIVITGQNNQVIHNLVTTIYWSGTAQPSHIAEYNINYDAAIMTRSAVSVVMRVGFVYIRHFCMLHLLYHRII